VKTRLNISEINLNFFISIRIYSRQ